jgi:hypothetical protein
MPRATFLPLTKSISIEHGYASGVHFTDLAGATVNASYVQVAPLEASIAGIDEGFYMLEPSGLVGQTYSSTTSGTLPGATNASACVMGGPNNPVVELSLQYKSTIDSVKISNNLGLTTSFVITYGHIRPSADITDSRILVDGSY